MSNFIPVVSKRRSILKRSPQNKKKNNKNKTSSDKRSVPHLKEEETKKKTRTKIMID